MSFKLSVADCNEFHMGITDTVEQIQQNVNLILSTVQGTVPMYRDFGLSAEAAGLPTAAAESILKGQIEEAIEEYEPRVTVNNIDFITYNGQLAPIVEVEINIE